MDPQLLTIYENCLTARSLDEHLQKLFYSGEVPVALFMSGVGAEVGSGTVATLLQPHDSLIPHYRGFAEIVSKQMPVEKIAAEILRKKTGPSKGVGDSCPFHDVERNVFGSSMVLGTKFSIAIGIGLGMKLKNDPGIIAVFFGDGESSRSTFGSALNLASLWELPILFVCRNNSVSINATIEKMSSTKTIAERAQGYDVSTATVQDTDWEQLYEKSKESIAFVRNKRRPFLLEIEERRFTSHTVKSPKGAFFSDMIPNNEDPLHCLERALLKTGVPSEDLSKRKKKITALVETSIQSALETGSLSPEDILSTYYE